MNAPRTPATYDFYTPIHKGLRMALGHLLARLGAADLENAADTAPLFADLRQQLRLSAMHLSDEDTVIHPAIESRAPGATATLLQDHQHHRAELVELDALLRSLEFAAPHARQSLGRTLYLRFAHFIARDFAHMHHEETVTLPLLQALFTDEELKAMEGRIAALLSLDDLVAFITIMLPAMNPGQRLSFLSDLRTAVPTEVFAAIEAATQRALNEVDWRRLEAAMRLPPSR